ncbi:MAG: signal peptidase I [Lachnospiraceae bacterium]|nr:signal peptidase I [Lachnospiraceae bacterium]
MKRVFEVAADILAWVLLIVAFFVTLTVLTSTKNDGVARLFGYTPMSVQSNSMKPTFNKGDLILVKKVDDLYSLKENDVITFYTIVEDTKIINTHRIVKIEKKDNSISFITRGDNNPVDDEIPVVPADIIGKWTGKSFGKVGVALDFVQTQKGFFICIIIPIAIIFLFELYKFIQTLIEVKTEGLQDVDEEEIKKKAIEEYLAKQQKEAQAQAAQAQTTTEQNIKGTEQAAEEMAEKVEADPADDILDTVVEQDEEIAESVEQEEA